MHSFLQSDHNCSLRNALTLRSPLGEQLRSIYLHGSTERASKCYFLCLVSTHHCPHTTLSNPPKTLKKEDVRIHVHVYHSTLDGSGVHCKAQSRPSHKTQRPTITYMLHQRRKQRCNDDATTTQRRKNCATTQRCNDATMQRRNDVATPQRHNDVATPQRRNDVATTQRCSDVATTQQHNDATTQQTKVTVTNHIVAAHHNPQPTLSSAARPRVRATKVPPNHSHYYKHATFK